MKLIIGLLSLMLTAEAFALSCSIMTSNLSANCSAALKQDKGDFTSAADANCRSSGLPGFHHVNSWQECNDNGSKCKKMQGECKPALAGTGFSRKKPHIISVGGQCTPPKTWSQALHRCIP
jgi:hypothetical protein